ncbi:unnamed protein product [Phytophthora fragariaefolia]|uniref:Unnamed protein product n=1 Tax=Phytophthora fragariaefolia TaxID=1490495 RepID=A0A9W6Y4N8_9STRA|nr:unnamed protein product [Phytophthora fragariaefolia]
MVAASPTNAASGTHPGPARLPLAGVAADGVEGGISELRGPGIARPRLRPRLSGSASGNSPPGADVGKTAGPQMISVDRATAHQTLGLLPSGQGSSSGMPVVVKIPPGEPSDITVRVVGVPAPEIHSDGRTFLQDGFGGLEALVQMESLGAT